ncbi:MAG: BadF/BadG/BcrA/BcrD ATPase family protein [Candidatus Bathyarchaeia archaeon]|jgi:N-acetylglucosamine kinase-like BadF-type ATPase
MMLVSGVDGGATKTVAVVGRLDGTLLASARGPSSNYHNIGIGKAAKSIRICVNSACRHAHASSSSLETVVMGLAGMDSPMDFRAGQRVADLADLGGQRIVVHDSVIAIYAATLGRPGIVVNAGTGSFVAGIGLDGKPIRASGWGNIIDDEGSAYDIGRRAMRASLRALDGTERKTTIAKLLVRKFRLHALEDIVYEVHNKPMSTREISSISKLVAQAAVNGDQVARGIFAYEGRAMASFVSAIARRLEMTKSKPDIYCTGGVFKAGPLLLNPFKRELRKSVLHFTLRHPRFEPVIGAFILALKEHGVAMRGVTLANLESSHARRAVNIR